MPSLIQLRKQVKEYIDAADIKVVKMVHAMLKIEREEGWWQDDEILSVVAERSADYKSGKVKAIPWETARKEITSSRKKTKK